jgi:small-conductance mechanosensitive channel
MALSAVGIGLGLQKLAANYVSGFVILAERSLRIGDIVNVGGFEGAITDITTRYTVIRAPSGRESIVPNETLTTTAVQNLSLADRRVLLSTVLVVGHDTDVVRLREQLIEAVVAVPRVLADPGPAAQLSRLGNDGLEISVHFWIDDPENGQGNVRSEVNLAILALLRREGIGLSSGPQVLRLEAPAVPAPVMVPAAGSAR